MEPEAKVRIPSLDAEAEASAAAQSFAYASSNGLFAHTLTIVIHRSDAEKYNLNLFEIRDYLAWGLDV